MRPLDSLTAEEAQHLRGLLFDLDDTLLDHGKLGEAAYQALFRLREAGLELFVVTGRPLGWAEVLVRLWPIAGAVSENGGALVLSGAAGVKVQDSVGASERRERRQRLSTLVELLRAKLPDLVPASDVDARRTDFTFDIGETRTLPAERVQEARRLAEAHGASTLVSSVHLHVTFDRADKASGAVRLLAIQSQVDATAALSRYAFIGDSENDAAC
ncbi:MAG TPA: HAD-IIB family hydrolase, partial [Polyangiaceae bacterium]|nr:HAD-IIB family hydrolase [Polyangiaceae bacterium]